MSTTSRTVFLVAAAWAATAWAQAPGTQSPAAAPAYDSAFGRYRPFAAAEVQDWRKSNDTVHDAGGWRAAAREMQGASSQAPSPAAAASAAQPPNRDAAAKPANPHQGHHQ